MKLPRRLRALRDQLESVGSVDWRAPAWWGFAGGTLLLDLLAERSSHEDRAQHEYLSANGGPRSDNYMGREARPPGGPAEAVAKAVARALAALDAIDRVEPLLIDQPLHCALAWRDGWLRPQPLPAGDRSVAFATPRGTFVGSVTPASATAVATALGALLAGREPLPNTLRRIDPDASTPTAAAVAVSLGTHSLSLAQHSHRAAWTAGGGPWLGVADTPPLEVVTTCHVVVDGYGHALLTDAILQATERSAAALRAPARLGLGRGNLLPLTSLPTPAGATPLSFAGRTAQVSADFAACAHAFGRALEGVFCAHRSVAERRQARFSPSFQVPIAPGQRDDPDRRRRRVIHALLSLRMNDGSFESLGELRERLPPLLDRELAGEGILPRLSRGCAGAPLPRGWRRRLLQSRHQSHRWMPPFELLAGRGRFSSMRFAPGERPAAPLYAVSSPTLLVTPEDPLGAVVLTLIHHEGGALTATASGTGLVGSDRQADAFLDRWLDELASASELAPPTSARRSERPGD